MQYQYFNSKDIDYERWNNVLDSDPSAPAFAYSWYLDAVANNWGALISQDYNSIFPIAYRKKFGISYIYQPFFTRNFGLYGKKDYQKSHLQIINILLNKFRYWDFSIEKDNIPITSNSKVHFSQRIFQTLDLNISYSELQKNYSAKLNRNIRLARAEKLKIVAVNDISHFSNEFKKYTSSRISAFHQIDYDRLKTLLEKARENAETIHYAIQNENKEISSAFFVKTGNRILYLEGYSSPEGRNLRSMHLIFDTVIREHSSQKLLLDFGGSNIPTIAHFFRSFGATDQIYFNIKMNNLPILLKWLKK